jgi:hypothetical protein
VLFQENRRELKPPPPETSVRFKEWAGNFMYHIVSELTSKEHAPKLTGMMIDLEPKEVLSMVKNFDVFVVRLS